MTGGRLSRGAPARILAAIPPASGAVVMGTGIVSVSFLVDGRRVLSDALLAVAAVVWLALVLLLPARALADRGRFQLDARQPAALTSVAGTAVLGTRLTLVGWGGVGAALLVLAAALWAALVPNVLAHWARPTIGASFILTVATESLALLSAVLAAHEHAGWLLYASLVPFGLGLGFYLFVLSAFQYRQLAIGRGDHWVTGGALAISTVAAARVVLAAEATGVRDGLHDALKGLAVVLWGLTMVWLPVLLAGEVLHPRLGYTVRRWSTVFPFGMYAACSFSVAAATGSMAIRDFARAWVWVALAVWLAVFAGMVRRAPDLLAGRAPAAPLASPPSSAD